ncbi:glycosyltransferase family 2 protein [Chitinophaga sancti]|uniref:Dolichol-phosphate mannosyltransferase n=1 Tax=Chitinophaga sancti TaxID=1004 RepID=A0A1K1RQS2_9BACT|nr:glycosyltransferase family 2 protein [Chitinophaga sancti]WQD62473.1 glycosyltransferase family 2 protein [Chitinophaga sancti]WQG91958.1 glycosyltransferase family 2 protein [Chitinophaga sancti]SFW74441.1 dolichol-phosphate mannosyltransferase [Chitinophaga sancti]
MTLKSVTIVIPIYNERDNIYVLKNAIHKIFAGLHYKYNILYVDDGSSDGTPGILAKVSQFDDRVEYVSLSRNFGHQAALKAGLDMADGDCVISMDGDMQHPASVLPLLLKQWEEGYDIVNTVRLEDKKLSYFKRKSSRLFYKLINHLSEFEIRAGSADFRLVSRKALDVICSLNEHDPFFRGLVSWIGFSQTHVVYQADERSFGSSKYSFKKMVQLAVRGITSFSIRPLYVAIYPGILISLMSSLYIPYALYSYFAGEAQPGWTSLIVTVSFFSGLQLMLLGIIGMYLGKVTNEVKKRPVYIIKESSLTKIANFI